MTEHEKVLLNKAKDLQAYCEVADCELCVFKTTYGKCVLNEPSPMDWNLKEREESYV